MKCAHCGSEFTAVRPTATYCSGRCRVAAHRNRNAKPSAEEKQAALGYAIHLIEMLKAELDKGEDGDPWSIATAIDEALSYLRELSRS